MTEFAPATPTEQILVERMTNAQWLSLRAFRLQSEAFQRVPIWRAMVGELLPKELSLLIRYQTSADRAFHRAQNELVRPKKKRPTRKIGFDPKKAETEPAPPVELPADFPRVLTKTPAPPAACDLSDHFKAAYAKTGRQ